MGENMSRHFENGNSTKELRVVLLGSAGSGKSRTGNMLFESGGIFSFGSQSVAIESHCEERFGLNIQVIDTPGYIILDETKIKEDSKEILKITNPGPNAFFLCIPVGRFTNEVAELIDYYEKCYGSNIFDYIIVLFTQIDSWREDMEDLGNSCANFDEYIDNLPKTAKSLLKKCKNRYFSLDNTRSNEHNEVIAKKLFDAIKRLIKVNPSPCYKDKSTRNKVWSFVSYFVPNSFQIF